MAARMLALMVAAVAAWSMAVPPAHAQAQDDVTVFAAASLRNALDAVNAAWREAEGRGAVISYAASSALARQIEQGAPADIFISADLDWMEHLSQRGLTRTQSELQLLGNRIVLVAGAGSDIVLAIAPGFDLASALGDGRLAMANVDAVPAGRYGKAALEALGIWEQIEGRVAQAENVRAALALVSLGEAPLGIVYQTDAAADPGVRVVDVFPQDTHPPIVYPVAVTAASDSPHAQGFVDFLHSPAARVLFEAQGFTMLVPAGNP